MMAPFRLLERQELTAPLGVRFWDVATGTPISSGLSVWAYPDGKPQRATRASPNRSGTYVLHHASGLSDFERGVDGGEFTETSPARRRFTVEVSDEQRRFLPARFDADLPCKGLFKWLTNVERAPLDLPNNSAGVPLYSSTLRTAPAGMTVLRAELYEALAPGSPLEVLSLRPAAWAVLEAREGGRLLGRGMADERGRIVLIFAYPAPREPSGSFTSSPPGAFGARLPFLKQEWAIELQAFYGPTAPASPPSSPPLPAAGEASSGVPYLNDLLDQPPADLFLDEAQTEPLTEVTLMFGPSVFTRPSSSSASSPLNRIPLSILFVSPAGSPPS